MENVHFSLSDANILIVSNSDKCVYILTNILNQKEYYNIMSISRNELTVEYSNKNIPDIIFLNVDLLAKECNEVFKIIQNEYFKDIPTVFICDNNIKEENLVHVENIDYFIIPFDFCEFFKCIEAHLKVRFMELELKKLNIKNKHFFGELKRENQKLIIENRILKNEVLEKEKQMEEITLELKEFNILLDEEITERTKTEEALKESERQFRNAVEKAPVPIMLYAEDGIVRKINKTWNDITKYSAEDLPTIFEWSEISEAFKTDLKDLNRSRLFNSKKRQSDGEFSINPRNGEARIWNFYSSYIGELQDGNRLFMKVAIDITEKKQMEELQESIKRERQKLYEIKEYDRIKTEFFSNISHELRTPINVIFSALQMHELKLMNCAFKNETTDKYKYTKIMKQNCYRILRLINNIIDITKIDSGYFDVNEQNVNIINLVENITLSVADYIENKGISLIFDTEIEEKFISCDPEKMERIILNLLSNAVKFTPLGGKIMVMIEERPESICVRVKDTGRGIPEEKLNVIFERFMQVDKSLTRDHEGSGIGLSLVKCLVELHGGEIVVKSRVDYGTEFIIHIPCKSVKPEKEEFYFCDSIGENYIEKINIEFSDIYN
ncbi:PAS domain-containing sensor histidine kinase [Clostridium sp.]|uniref:PAS domain-containing sensor histidine kinase n=1 Tax=Clostridium sp. TaxID=1506 RepID=UPI002851FFDB|nr:PAS domain-containing sensor histidine kinase [Clostridium sp.]MDR3595772.1 PAS domain-containing sensor histidine kinase [Clostridium sp.]